MFNQGTRRLAGLIMHASRRNLRRFQKLSEPVHILSAPAEKSDAFQSDILTFFELKLNNNNNEDMMQKSINRLLYCMQRNVRVNVEKIGYQQILKVLNGIATNQVKHEKAREIYHFGISVLKQALVCNKLNAQEKLQFLFYCSLIHSDIKLQPETKYQFHSCLKDLSLYEKCILAECCFMFGIKLNNEGIECMENALTENCEYLMSNVRLLVCLCKIIRFSGPSKNLDLSELSVYIAQYSGTFNLPTISHVLQLYGEMLLIDHQAVDRFISDLTKQLQAYNTMILQSTLSGPETQDTEQLAQYLTKVKYIDNILWSLNRLNYRPCPADFDQIWEYIDTMFNNLLAQPSRLLNILLCLWSLEYRMEEKIKKCLNTTMFLHLSYHQSWKTRARLRLLFDCISIEAPHIKIPTELFNRDDTVHAKTPESLKMVARILIQISSRLQFSHIRIHCPVRELTLPGVSFTHPDKGKIHVDLLTDKTRLRHSQKPAGFLSLKVRLLSKIGYQSVLIDEQNMLDTVSSCVHIEDRITECLNIT